MDSSDYKGMKDWLIGTIDHDPWAADPINIRMKLCDEIKFHLIIR